MSNQVKALHHLAAVLQVTNRHLEEIAKQLKAFPILIGAEIKEEKPETINPQPKPPKTEIEKVKEQIKVIEL